MVCKFAIAFDMHRILLLGVILIFLSLSCRKIQERKILTGEWEFISGYMNHDTTINILDVVLPYHSTDPSNCYYQIMFEDDGIVYGNYYTYDTLNYAVVGEWELKEFNVFYIKLDQYIDGTFLVENEGDHDYKLISNSDSNMVSWLGLGIVYAEMTVHREKRED